MDKKNVVELEKIIGEIGFTDSIRSLVRRICFRPDQFTLTEVLHKGEDKVIFDLNFERVRGDGYYVLNYYDAILQKSVRIDDIVGDVDTKLLEERMAAINWQNVFGPGKGTSPVAEEEDIWTVAEVIESIIDDLSRLEAGPGNEIAVGLKSKFWSGTLYREFTGGTLPNKIRSDVCQRFFVQVNNIISSEEAYRFLQNRWLERELHAKRKTTAQHGEYSRENNIVHTSVDGTSGKRKAKRKGHKNK